MRQHLCTAALALSGLAAAAHADVLWDQSALNWNGNGFINTISGNPPFGATGYTVADVSVGAGGWTLDSITMYFTCFDFNWQSETTGRVYVQSKTGSLPTVLPGGPLVSMSVEILNDPTVGQAYYAVTASGLNRALAAGDYWIGITPAAPSGFFGPEIGLSALNHSGTDSATYNLADPRWQTVGVDAAILLQGRAVPAPAGLAALGLSGLLAARRRR